jgi:hypothetical protein
VTVLKRCPKCGVMHTPTPSKLRAKIYRCKVCTPKRLKSKLVHLWKEAGRTACGINTDRSCKDAAVVECKRCQFIIEKREETHVLSQF